MARSIDLDRSADCHSSGSVPTAAHAVKGVKVLTLCGHHLTRCLDRLIEEQWEIIPVKRTPGRGAGTEATPDHYSLGERA